MNLVFLLEDRSMKEFLEGFLPRILPDGAHPTLIAHEGKSDLERSIPRKLRAWRAPDARFVVVRDEDNGDCSRIKRKLVDLCAEGGRPDTLVRIACRELEAWFLGDLQAVERVFGVSGLSSQAQRRKYRDPDRIGAPSQELMRLVPGYGKVGGARRLGPRIDLDRCCSPSFHQFVRGIRRLLEER